MFNKSYKITLFIVGGLSMMTTPVFANNWADILDKVDKNRVLALDGVVTSVTMKSYKKGNLDKTENLTVYTNANMRNSVVVFHDKKRRGQKMLMTEKGFWMLMPKSSRPVRISAVQKVMGQASSGDIASLSYSQDYDVQSGKDNGDGTALLSLIAKHKNVSYKTIKLTVNTKKYQILSADYFLKSGKQSKTATMQYGDMSGKVLLKSMTLLDSIRKNQKTVMTYNTQKTAKLPNKIFNPRYLLGGGKLPND